MSTDSSKAAAPGYAPERQCLPAARLAAAGAEARTALLSVLRRSETFYTAQNGSLSRFEDLPICTGDDLANEIGTHPPFGRLQLRQEPLIRAGLATAGVPRPVPICWSQADLDLEAQLGARAFWRAGLRPRGRSSDCLDGGLVTPGTLAVTDALDALDALALPVGPITDAAALDRVREVWRIVQPQVLILNADSFAFLEHGDRLGDRAAAVLLTPEHRAQLAAPPQPNVYRVLSLPLACTFLAGECDAHSGLHVAEDAIAVETVDAAGAAVPDGAAGRLIVSTLQRSAAVLRFDTGVRASLDRKPCPCGETHVRLHFN